MKKILIISSCLLFSSVMYSQSTDNTVSKSKKSAEPVKTPLPSQIIPTSVEALKPVSKPVQMPSGSQTIVTTDPSLQKKTGMAVQPQAKKD